MSCPFCERIAANDVTRESQAAVAFPDAFPVAEGHTLVVPRRHVSSIWDLTPAEQDDVWTLVRTVRAELSRDLRPDAFTIGANDGDAAGQTVAHAHVHVIARRTGDVPDPRGGIRWVIPEKARYWD